MHLFKGVKIFHFSIEIIFGQLLQTFGVFLLVTPEHKILLRVTLDPSRCRRRCRPRCPGSWRRWRCRNSFAWDQLFKTFVDVTNDAAVTYLQVCTLTHEVRLTHGAAVDYCCNLLLRILVSRVCTLRLIHTSCIWRVGLRQTVAVRKIRTIPISAETQLSAAAPQIKFSSCESPYSKFSPPPYSWHIASKENDLEPILWQKVLYYWSLGIAGVAISEIEAWANGWYAELDLEIMVTYPGWS